MHNAGGRTSSLRCSGSGTPITAPFRLLRQLLLRLAAAACCAVLLAAARPPARHAGLHDAPGAPQVDGGRTDADTTWTMADMKAGALAAPGRRLQHPTGCHKKRCMPRCPRCRIPLGKRMGHCHDTRKYYVCVENWSASVDILPATPKATPAPSRARPPRNRASTRHRDKEGGHDSVATEEAAGEAGGVQGFVEEDDEHEQSGGSTAEKWDREEQDGQYYEYDPSEYQTIAWAMVKLETGVPMEH